jgi:hypothetical protein
MSFPKALAHLLSAALFVQATTLAAADPVDSAAALPKKRQEYFDAWKVKTDAAQIAFITCVKTYAATHLQTTLTATELGVASVSACERELAEFRNDSRALYSIIDSNTAEAHGEADGTVGEIVDGAKGHVLQMMAERPVKP